MKSTTTTWSAQLACVMVALLSLASSLQAQIIFRPMPGLDDAKQKAATRQCLTNLLQIYQAAFSWGGENSYYFPATFQTFTNKVSNPAVFYCPAAIWHKAQTNWNNVNWEDIDYFWFPQDGPFWPLSSGTNICKCLVHNLAITVDGEYRPGQFADGWPAIVAHPISQEAAPGSDVCFEVKVATNALLPVTYQWRAHSYVLAMLVNCYGIGVQEKCVTNYQTNWTGILDLQGQTNATLCLTNVQPSHEKFYSVLISNSLGATLSGLVQLYVDASVQSSATNAHDAAIDCLTHMRQIQSLAASWAGDHSGRMPASFAEMTNSYGYPMFGWPYVLFCRADKTRTAPPNWQDFDFNDTSYELVSNDPANGSAVFCRCKVHDFALLNDSTVITKPKFAGARRLSDNRLHFDFLLAPNRTNSLEYSTNLVDWTTLATYYGTNGECSYLETNTLGRRFYRLRDGVKRTGGPFGWPWE